MAPSHYTSQASEASSSSHQPKSYKDPGNRFACLAQLESAAMVAKRRRSQEEPPELMTANRQATDDLQGEAPLTTRRRSDRSSANQHGPSHDQGYNRISAAYRPLVSACSPSQPQASQQIIAASGTAQNAHEDHGPSHQALQDLSNHVNESLHQLESRMQSTRAQALQATSYSAMTYPDTSSCEHSASGAPRRPQAHREVLDLLSNDAAGIDEKRSALMKSHLGNAPTKKSKFPTEYAPTSGLDQMPQNFETDDVNDQPHVHQVGDDGMPDGSSGNPSSSRAPKSTRREPRGKKASATFVDDNPGHTINSSGVRNSRLGTKLYRAPRSGFPDFANDEDELGDIVRDDASESEDGDEAIETAGLSILDTDYGENLTPGERRRIELAEAHNLRRAQRIRKALKLKKKQREAAKRNPGVMGSPDAVKLPTELTWTNCPVLGDQWSQTSFQKSKNLGEVWEPWKMVSRGMQTIAEIPPTDGSCPLLGLPEELLFMISNYLTLPSILALSASCRGLNVFSHNHLAFPLPCLQGTYGFRAEFIHNNQRRRLEKHPNLAHLVRRKNYYFQQPTKDDIILDWSTSFVNTLRKIWYEYPKTKKSLRVRSCQCQPGLNTFNLRKEKYLGSTARIAHEAWHYIPSHCRRCGYLIWWATILNVESDQVTYTFSDRIPEKGERPIPLAYGEQDPHAAAS